MRIPKYINKKIDRMNNLIDQALSLRNEIESWAEDKGADISSMEWCEDVRDDCTSVTGISVDGMEEYFDYMKMNG